MAVQAPKRMSTKGSPISKADEPKSSPSLTSGGGMENLNFKVEDEFKRDFKMEATRRGMSMVDLLKEAFEIYKQHR